MTVEELHEGDAGSLGTALGGALPKDALLAYMCGCPVLLSSRSLVADRFDTSGRAIPMSWYSDGTYAWTAETIAYIDHYDTGVPVRFAEHMVGCGPERTSLTTEQRESVLEEIRTTKDFWQAKTPVEQWTVSFEADLRGFFNTVTRYYEGETDEEFMRVERQRTSAR